MRRTVLAGILAAALLVAVNATSAFAATTSDTPAPVDASSASTPATQTPTPAPSAVTPTADASQSSPSASTQAASDVHAAALATDIAVVEHPDPPQPPLIDSNGYPLLGVGFAGTPDRTGAVTYGGVSASGAASSAASWVWNGTSWSQVCAVCAPGVRGLSGMATDLAPATTGVVMYGGTASFGDVGLADTWVFADGAWTQLCATCPPGARLGVAMAGGGSAGDEVLLFGGAADTSGSPGSLFNDTWGFDGTTWILLDAGVSGDPAPRFGASMAWDGTRFILFGGTSLLSGGALGTPIDDGTWMWAGDHWTQLCANAAACGPAPRTLPRAAFLDSTDPSGRGVLLVGGLTVNASPIAFGDIWFWHDGQWIQQVSPWVDQQPFPPAGPLVAGGGVASLSALCQVSLVGQTAAGTVSTFNLGLDTNGDGVIDPCPVVPPPTPPPPTPENVVAPAAATAGTGGEATAAGTLPFTGSDLAGPMTFATALLGIGLVLVAGSRRRRAP
jgi:hypothetical protein